MADRNGKPQGIKIDWIFVDPDMARMLLDTSAKSQLVNRPLNRTNLRNLASDMSSGKYITTTTPLKFNRKQGLIDGQHRLHAVVESGVGQWFLVASNVDDQEILVEGTGLSRSLADADWIAMAGQIPHNVLRVRYAVSNVMMRGLRPRVLASGRDKKEFLDRHLEVIEWVMDLAGPAAMRSRQEGIRLPTAFLAVIARASYHIERSILERFVALMRDPLIGPGEGVVIVLRDYILQNPVGTGSRTRTALAIYKMTETALAAYVKRRDLKRLTLATIELYPLPTEERSLDHAAD